MRAIDADRLKEDLGILNTETSKTSYGKWVLDLIDREPTVYDSLAIIEVINARRIAELEVKVTELTAALAYETHELEGFKRRVKGRLERLGAMMVETIVEEMR